MQDPIWITTEELAARLRRDPGTIRYWRWAGTGPKGVKFGRRVLYRVTEVERWEREQERAQAASGAA